MVGVKSKGCRRATTATTSTSLQLPPMVTPCSMLVDQSVFHCGNYLETSGRSVLAAHLIHAWGVYHQRKEAALFLQREASSCHIWQSSGSSSAPVLLGCRAASAAEDCRTSPKSTAFLCLVLFLPSAARSSLMGLELLCFGGDVRRRGSLAIVSVMMVAMSWWALLGVAHAGSCVPLPASLVSQCQTYVRTPRCLCDVSVLCAPAPALARRLDA